MNDRDDRERLIDTLEGAIAALRDPWPNQPEAKLPAAVFIIDKRPDHDVQYALRFGVQDILNTAEKLRDLEL